MKVFVCNLKCGTSFNQNNVGLEPVQVREEPVFLCWRGGGVIKGSSYILL